MIEKKAIITAITDLYRYPVEKFVLPGDKRSVGVEDELILVDKNGNMGNAQIILEKIATLPEFTAKYDDVNQDVIVGVEHPDWGMLTTDAGLGLFELVSKPYNNLFDLDKSRTYFLKLLVKEAQKTGQFILGTGRQPHTVPTPEHWYPKGRYKMLRTAFPGNAIHEATTSASQQTHIGVFDVADMLELTNHLLAFSGLFTAIAANSPIYHGAIHTDRLASRQEFWGQFAPEDRVAVPLKAYLSIDDLIEHLLNSQFLFNKTDSGYECVGIPFIDYLQKQGNTNGALHTALLYHEGCMWQDARPRFDYKTVEKRGPDQQPQRRALGIPALTLGVAQNVEGRKRLFSFKDWNFWRKSREEGLKHGLLAKVYGQPIRELATELVKVAKKGLLMRGLGEEELLEPLATEVTDGISPALQQIAAFQKGGTPELIEQFKFRF